MDQLMLVAREPVRPRSWQASHSATQHLSILSLDRLVHSQHRTPVDVCQREAEVFS